MDFKKESKNLEKPKSKRVRIKSIIGQTKISVFPVESDRNIITIPERHSKIRTTSVFINDIKKRIKKIRKTNEFWTNNLIRPATVQKLKKVKPKSPPTFISQIQNNMTRRFGIKLTTNEIFALPFNEERITIEKEMLKEFMRYNDNIQATKIQKVFRGHLIRKHYSQKLRDYSVLHYHRQRCAKTILREWKIYKFKQQMKQDAVDRRDKALIKIQRFLRGYLVYRNTATLRTVATMAALRKTLFHSYKQNKAANTIQIWYRNRIQIIKQKRRDNDPYIKWMKSKLEQKNDGTSDSGKIRIVNRGGIIKRVNIDYERKLKQIEREKIEQVINIKKKKKNDESDEE